MYNWSVDTKQLKKDKKQYAIWRLEQLVNFGLGKEKLSKIQLKKYWPQLHLDPKKKRFLSFLLWPSKKYDETVCKVWCSY
ncbi:hypothetical protein EPN28_01140 [Patescibacteria group bacterium]|nr:MAG: hypothetical protein EPN28_01140 [Patescibacteria group bacterium]